MLQPFFEALKTLLLQDLSALPLREEQLGYQVDDHHLPYLMLSEGSQQLQTPQFKADSGETRRFAMAESFTIPSTRSKKKGPYVLSAAPAELVSVIVIEKPGSEAEALSTLTAADFTISINELSLAEEYVGGTLLQINYKTTGLEYKDRFTQAFTLSISDVPTQPARHDRLAQLVPPCLWAHWSELQKAAYGYRAGALWLSFKLSDLQFVRQHYTCSEELATTRLQFSASGQVTYRYLSGGGLHTIEEVRLGGLETVIPEPDGGLAIGIKKESEDLS